MRRFGYFTRMRVSSCGLCLSRRAITPTPFESPQQMRTTSTSAGDGDVASDSVAAPSSSRPCGAAMPTPLAAPAPPATILYAPPPASSAPATAAPSESLGEMTERLRAALRALSEAERAKAQLSQKDTSAMDTSGQSSFENISWGRAEHTTLASATSTPVEARAGDGGGSRAGSSISSSGTDERAVAATTSASVGVHDRKTASSAAATPPLASSSPSWIRNKKRKFWALVNKAGAVDLGSNNKVQGPSTTTTNSGDVDKVAAAAFPGDEASPASTTARELPVSTPRASSLLPPALAGVDALAVTNCVHDPTPGQSPEASLGVPTTSLPSGQVAGVVASSAVSGTKGTASLRSLRAAGDSHTAHSIRVSTSVSPFRNRYKRDVAIVLSELLSSDPSLGAQLLGQLSAESRRLLLIMGAASEYFGVDYEEVAEQVKEADTDRDNSISSKEYDAWAWRIAASTPAKRRHSRDSQVSADMAGSVAPLDSASFQGVATVSSSMPPTGVSGGSQDAARASSCPETGAARCRSGFPPVAESSTQSLPHVKAVMNSTKAVGSLAAPSEAPLPPSVSLERSDTPRGGSYVREGVSTGAVASFSPPCTPSSTPTGAAGASIKQGPSYIPWQTFLRIVVAAAPPFLAFGMLDNSILVLAGGAIDNALSDSLGLSQMAAAGLGGVVSGIAGIQVHGLAERYTRVAPPQLTAEQQQSDCYSCATHVGITLGMVIGLILGMTPLLFMGGSTPLEELEERDRHFFQEEALRSHQRQCIAVQREEATQRQRLMMEEVKAMRELWRRR